MLDTIIEQALEIEKLENAIRIANECLKAGEGIDLLYYMDSDDEDDKEARPIIEKIIKGEK